MRVGALVAALTMGAAVPGAWAAEESDEKAKKAARKVRSLRLRLENLERSVERLSTSYEEPVAVMRRNPLDTQLIEAQVRYDTENYEGAAVLLLDLVKRTEFQSKDEYPGAALMLGRTLRELDQNELARKYFEVALEQGGGETGDSARYELLRMGLEQDDRELMRRMIGRGEARRARTRYAAAKARLRLGSHRAAAETLRSLRDHEELGRRARYYLGVAHTALGEHERAEEAFESLAGIEVTGETTRKVRDLALLALGRLRMERGDRDGAVNAYQRIPRQSDSYARGLYEMAWAYIKAEEHERALDTIDVLLLVVEDTELDVKAHTLRGRLNIFRNRYDEAVESFDKIVKRFAPVRNELREFSESPDSLREYFEWLMERRIDETDLESPLTEKTRKWVLRTRAMKRFGSTFDEIGMQERRIREAKSIGRELQELVSAKSAVELFPELREGWNQAMVLQNQLLSLTSTILDFQHEQVRSEVAGELERELETRARRRRRLEARLHELPMSGEGYEQREKQAEQGLLDLERKVFVVEQRLKRLRRQLAALQERLKEERFQEGGRVGPTERQRELMQAVEEEKTRIEELQSKLDQLREDIEIASKKVGTGDRATRSEAELREALITAQKREGLLYDEHFSSGGGKLASRFQQLSEQRSRIWSSMEQLRAVLDEIDAEVEEKVAEVEKVIQTEVRDLERLSKELTSVEESGRALAQRLGEELFQEAQERIADVVLRAELGRIDVAWHQKRRKSGEIKEVNQERSRRLQALNQTLDELTSERIELSEVVERAEEQAEKKDAEDEGGDAPDQVSPSPSDVPEREPESEPDEAPGDEARSTSEGDDGEQATAPPAEEDDG